MQILRGRTSQSIPVQFQDTTSVIGGGKTGLVFNTSGLICYYKRELDTQTRAVTLATKTIGTWATGGFVELDATHMPGSFEFGIPNAAISASDASTWVEIVFSGVSGAFAPPLRLDLVAFDPQSSTDLGLSTLAAIQAKTDLIGTATNLVVISPVVSSSRLAIVPGDAYYNADGRAVYIAPTSAPSLVGGSIVLRIGTPLSAAFVSVAGTITAASVYYIELATTDTVKLSGLDVLDFDIIATLASGHPVTIAQGKVTVTANVGA